ncbi:MAG: DNA topoisomerase IV subunit A [Alphaproteobacteria bacterium]|nr:MAG: DNA topoisomerase IV subunit A [Alphaproteobacteria bacterium]
MSAPSDMNKISHQPLGEALGERYLSYALSTIMNRALPDVRDGLKPVHRRLLYAMRQLKLDANSSFKKSARVVGDVIGRFHPHGDQAVYDALVRLAQDFAVRYPLIDGQGNFGNIDGDNAAAMRYTESRLTEVAGALLEFIDLDTVDFRETYDGEDKEPVVLPGGFPNLLANGAAGIAVGMATSIPPHNAGEICDALLHLLKTPNAGVAKLVGFMPGPDLPTGGIIVESTASILEAYTTGRGGFRVRAKWEKEELPRGVWQIVVTEIPYQVQKSRLIEKIAELIQTKKVPLLEDVRDESAEDIRLVLVPRSRSVDPEILMESLFKLTELENRISLNMNVLDADQIPRVMNLKEILQAFIDHRRDVLIRRSNFRLDKIERRLEVLAGYLIAYLNLDEVIRIIREEDEPKEELMKAFKLTDVQAEAILNMRLRSLRKLEEMELRTEDKELKKEKADLKKLLKSVDLQDKALGAEFKDIKVRFGQKTELGRRRTDFAEAPTIDVGEALEALVEREPVTVICSEKGWIRAMKGHVDAATEVKYKEGDRERFRFHADTHDKILVFCTNGRFYTIGADKLPGGRGNGEPIRLIIDLENDQDIVSMMVFKGERTLLVAATSGHGFLVPESDVVANTRKGKVVLNVKGAVEAQACTVVDGDKVAVIGENNKLLLFSLDELPTMSRGRGVVLQRYKDGGLSDVTTYHGKDGLIVPDRSGRMHTYTDLRDWEGKRGNAGRLPPRGFPKQKKLNP